VAEQRDLAGELSRADAVLADAETARFQIADVTGWQGLGVADAVTFGPQVALAPDSYNRAGLLDSKEAVYAWLDEVDTSAMDADEAQAFAELRRPGTTTSRGTTSRPVAVGGDAAGQPCGAGAHQRRRGR
jgi:methyl-accepting chemotaxis protein